MWSRIEGVAGKVRTNVSQLAKDVLEGGEDDSPQQACFMYTVREHMAEPSMTDKSKVDILQGSNLSTFSTGVQQSTMPQSLHGQYTPYSQAAGVHAAQQAAPWPVQANPVAHQHRPLQQIPFMPQRSLNTQQAPKPQLFVPQPVQAQRIVHEVDQDAHAHVTIAKASEPAAQGGTQASTTRPAVSTRLSALKAKLDQDKHRSAEEKAPTRFDWIVQPVDA